MPGHRGHSHCQRLPAPGRGAAAPPAGHLHQAVTQGRSQRCLGRSTRGSCPRGRRCVSIAVKPKGRKRGNSERRARRKQSSFPQERLVAQRSPRGALGPATEIRKLQHTSQTGEPDILLRGKNRDVLTLPSQSLKRSELYPKAALRAAAPLPPRGGSRPTWLVTVHLVR